MQSIKYLTLQATMEGQAAHAHVHEIVDHLRKLGHPVQLFHPNYGDVTPGVCRRLLEFLRLNLRTAIALRRFDVLYVRAHVAAWPVALWAKARGIPVVQEVNGGYEDVFAMYPWLRRLGRFPIWSMRAPLKWADAVIVVTPELKDWVTSEVGPKRISVIPNGANVEVFHPGAHADRSLPQPYVVFFGALSPWQGVDDLIAALEQPEWPDDVSLVVAGAGVQEQRVKKASANNSRLIYLGRVPYREVPGIVAGSLASLIPKNNDANHQATGLSPLKLYESMACGVPCIVTDLPGLADTIRAAECGAVVPPSDPQGLAQAVRACASDSVGRRAMGDRARVFAVHAHSWQARARDTHELIVTLTTRN